MTEPISARRDNRETTLTHVLFDGEIRRHPALRSLLWQWGVTVGSLPAEAERTDPVTVEDCDVIMHLCGESAVPPTWPGAVPADGATEGATAAAAPPLLVIGRGPVPPSSWIVIPDPGPGGCRLKSALLACQERAQVLRGDQGSRRDLAQFRDFLSHELRSPLTAIKTALAALGAEPSGAGRVTDMLEIARRNLGRLEQTVEWSQELMALAETPPAAELAAVRLAKLSEALPERLGIRVAGPDRSDAVLTDPKLLGILAEQMGRVLSFACPTRRPSFRLEFDAERGEGLLVATVLTAPHGEGPAPVSRAGKLGDETDQAGLNRIELEHLARMLISPELLQALGVRIRIAADSSGVAEVSLGLPAWAEADCRLPVPVS